MVERPARRMDQIHLWPSTEQLPSCRIHDSPPAVSVRFAREWSIHLPVTADGGAYLHRLAVVAATCADVLEEGFSGPSSSAGPEARHRKTVR